MIANRRAEILLRSFVENNTHFVHRYVCIEEHPHPSLCAWNNFSCRQLVGGQRNDDQC